MKTKSIIIYRLICLITNMSYIGKTDDFHRRMNEHIIAESFIGNAIRKYELDNFKIEFLWEAVSEEEANIVEKAVICAYRTRVPNGYNIMPGGEGGDYWSGKKRSEHREFMQGNKNLEGYKHTKEAIEKMRLAKLGTHHSKEAIEKTRQAHLGWKNPNAHSVQSKIKRLKTRLKKLEEDI